MRKTQIKLGELFAYHPFRGAYRDPYPLVFLAGGDKLFRTYGTAEQPEGAPYYREGLPRKKPGRDKWHPYQRHGYAVAYLTKDSPAGREKLLAATLDDFLAFTGDEDADEHAMVFGIVDSLREVSPDFEAVKEERRKAEREERRKAQEITRQRDEAQHRYGAVSEALRAFGLDPQPYTTSLPGTYVRAKAGVQLSLSDAERLAELLKNTPNG